jgi:hypothetical protein
MAQSHCLSGLVAKRAELAGEMLELEKQLEAIRSKLRHLDATILLFDPHHAIAAIKPKRPAAGVELFQNGELSRLIYDVYDALRDAGGGPMTVRAIAVAVAAAKGFDRDDRDLFADVHRRVGKALRKKACGVLRRVPLDGRAIGWVAAD